MNSQYGIANAIRLIYQMGGNALQVCVSNLQETKVGKPLEQQDVTDTLALREKFGIYLVVHGKYVYNFCRITWAWQLKCLAFELEQAGRVNADLVIHQGKNLPELFLTREEAIRNYVRQIESVLMDYPGQNRILLENSCKQGNELGSTVQEQAEIYHLFLPEVRHAVDEQDRAVGHHQHAERMHRNGRSAGAAGRACRARADHRAHRRRQPAAPAAAVQGSIALPVIGSPPPTVPMKLALPLARSMRYQRVRPASVMPA